MTSVIAKTRQGYAYQDKLSLSIFLDKFSEEKDIDFFTDFSFDVNESLDIRYKDASNTEHIYEIKSGEGFPESENNIYKSIAQLFEYRCKNDSEIKCYIFTQESSHVYQDIKSDLDFIPKRDNATRPQDDKKPSEVAEDFHERLKESVNEDYEIVDISYEDFRKFIVHTKIDTKSSGTRRDENDIWPDIEDEIISKIKDIAGDNYNNNSDLIKNEVIMFDLLYHLREAACVGESFTVYCASTLANHFAVRELLHEEGLRSSSRSLEKKIEEIKSNLGFAASHGEEADLYQEKSSQMET